MGGERDAVSTGVLAHIEKLIAVGDLAAGDRLPSERELAARLGVSRASLREAMRDLESRRLVERRPGRGTTVLPPPEHVQAVHRRMAEVERQARDVTELRVTLEPRLAELAAQRATAANVLALEELLRRPVAELAPDESLELDLGFHQLVAAAAQNPLMAAVTASACSWTAETRVLSHASRHAREVSYLGHRAIFEAIAARDPDRARDAMSRHLADAHQLILDAVDGGGDR